MDGRLRDGLYRAGSGLVYLALLSAAGALMTPQEKAFLDIIAFSEGTSTSPITKNDGYDVIVTGVDGPAVFTDYRLHPFATREPVIVRRVPLLKSTAAGRYQILYRYWQAYRFQLALPDFSPASQDLVAIQQIKERGALPYVNGEDIDQAIRLCANIWASLPGNGYNQPQHPVEVLLAKYQEFSSGADA